MHFLSKSVSPNSVTETIMLEKRKRTQLTVADKLKILDRMKNGDKREEIMKDYNIVQRTLQRIAKSESQICQDSLCMQSTRVFIPPFSSYSVASLEKCQSRS